MAPNFGGYSFRPLVRVDTGRGAVLLRRTMVIDFHVELAGACPQAREIGEYSYRVF